MGERERKRVRMRRGKLHKWEKEVRAREQEREGKVEREVATFLGGGLSEGEDEVPHLPAHILCWQQPTTFLPLKELESNLAREECH